MKYQIWGREDDRWALVGEAEDEVGAGLTIRMVEDGLDEVETRNAQNEVCDRDALVAAYEGARNG